MRLVFMGTPEFSVPALRALIEAGYDIGAVYTQPPRPAGRGQREHKSPVHELAASKGLRVRTPVSLKTPEVQEEFAALKPDVAVVVAYGLILPPRILSIPQYGCLNIHASLLPRWRGAAPIQRAILAGDRETGITIMQMDEGLDTGAMLLTERLSIGKLDTGQTLHDRLAVLGGPLVIEALRGTVAGTILPKRQPEDGVTYASKLTREEARLDWSKPAEVLERQIRAFTPWPGAWFEVRGERIKVLSADVLATDASATPGTIIDGGLTIACNGGALRPTRLQRPGKGPLDANAFLRGFPLEAGTTLAVS